MLETFALIAALTVAEPSVQDGELQDIRWQLEVFTKWTPERVGVDEIEAEAA